MTARTIATLGGLGHAPLAGALVSALAIPAAWLLHQTGGFPLILLMTAAVALLGFWATRAGGERHAEPGAVVIGKLAGQWVALWPLSGGLWWMGADPQLFPWPGWVGGFLLFRLLDMLEPGPIGRAHRAGEAGVLRGDLLSGLLSALGVGLSAVLAHGMLA